jgi:protein-L-isoaspartate(D-aspartate) O-methyltransferase
MKTDTYRHKGLRRQLVEQIKQKGITDTDILQAIENVPRHFFMDSSFIEFAYEDKPFPIGNGQTISQPYTVAYQTNLLQTTKGHKVLEIGTGSGYQACVLAEMGVKVFTIERIKELYHKTKIFLLDQGYTIKVFYGDGYKGLAAFAPFDRILVTAGAPYIPDALKEQLKIGGRMVIPIDIEPGLQIMTSIDRTDESTFVSAEHDYFRFVPMIENKT